MKTKTTILVGCAVLAALDNCPGQLASNTTFTRITTGTIVTDAERSACCAWGDYDDDGWLDMVVGNGFTDAIALYRNNRDGTFTRVTDNQIATTISNTDGISWGDYDNDGDLDLFVVNSQFPGFLFRNDGNGDFTRMSDAEIALAAAYSVGCGWGDYDNDGFLDLVIANGNGENEHLFRNDRDGTFTRIFTGPIPTSGASSGFPAWGDYDNDGKLDLIVAGAGSNADSVTMLFHNESRGDFSRVASFPNMGPMEGAVEWGDYDNDGDLDLLGAKYFEWFNTADTILLVYRNDGNGNFTRIVLTSIPAVPAGATWGDYDNDGWLDIWFDGYHLPGLPNLAAPDYLFHNNGDGTFSRITEGEIVNTSGFSAAAAWGDYDNDGFLDLYVANGGYQSAAGSENFLYHNNGNNNRWLTVKCIGTASNRSGIGAKVRVRANIGGKTLWQLREVSGGNGKNGGGLRAYFGMGDATAVDILRIEWPSGTVQEFTDVTINQLLTIVEPPRLEMGGFAMDGSCRLQLTGAAKIEYDVQTSSDLTSWIPLTTLTPMSRTMLFTDPDATKAPRRHYRAVGPPPFSSR